MSASRRMPSTRTSLRRRDGQHGAQTVDAGGREEAEAGDAGVGDGGDEAVEDVRPLDRTRDRVAEPEVRAHVERGGEARAQTVDELLEGLGRVAQELRVGVDPVLAPDVGGHGGEDVSEGVGVQHLRSTKQKYGTGYAAGAANFR